MKMLRILLLFTLLAVKYQCTAQTKAEYVIYGTYCGMCEHNCIHTYKIQNDTLFVDSAASHKKDIEYRWKALSTQQYLSAKKIIDSIPDILYTSENRRVFGHPDAADQCGILVQIKIGDTVKRFDIDTFMNAIPVELRHYAKMLMVRP